MWVYDKYFRIEEKVESRVIFYCEVQVDFGQASHVSRRDSNLIQGTLSYVEKIQEMIQLYYRSFQCVIFKCM